MVLLIDNYDSFTFNLYQYLRLLGAEVETVRNDALSEAQLLALRPRHILISPGPGRPEESRLSLAAIRHFAGLVPILGVCLGHQALAHVAGAAVVRAPRVMHGKTSSIRHAGTDLFDGLPSPLQVARYHSLMVDETSLPPDWQVTARTDDEDALIMAMGHCHLPLFGVQFHPEAILSEGGLALLQNFLRL